MKTFTAQIKVKLEDVDSALITALEGGSNYWYLIDKSQVTTPENFERNKEIHYEFLDKVYQGGSIPIFDTENPEEKLGDLTNDSIQKGLNLLAEKHPDVLSNLITEQYDANDADIFFQLCIMGEIVFG